MKAPAPFHKLPYEERYKSMGEEAEGEFERRERNWERFGFNRPDGFELYQIPKTFQNTPDYMQVHNRGFPRLVEVMGIGSDETLKIKLNKITALQWWDASELDVWLWVWSSVRQTFADLKFGELMDIINREELPVGKFDNDTKLFFAIDSSLLHWNIA
jgi:hypothetical protein|tara:strand:- start:497 stop:970 length:474 start_codon:yes stop_codon:yes gene_type:complete